MRMVLLVLSAFGYFDVQCIGSQRIAIFCSGICGLKNFNDQEFVFTDTMFERFYSCFDHLHTPSAKVYFIYMSVAIVMYQHESINRKKKLLPNR